MEQIKFNTKRIISEQDWNNLVKTIYGRPYHFQQQNGCMERQMFDISIPSKYAEDEEEEMHNYIPEIINGKELMGVKFSVWLARDPNAPLNPSDEELKECNYYWGKSEEDKIIWKSDKSNIKMFYERNFYPSIYTIANDLYEKGYIEKGEYLIDINW